MSCLIVVTSLVAGWLVLLLATLHRNRRALHIKAAERHAKEAAAATLRKVVKEEHVLAREAVAFAGSVRAAVSELEHEVDSKVVGPLDQEDRLEAKRRAHVPRGPRIYIETNYGKMHFELTPAKTPYTVERFLDLALSEGFYNGCIFHKVVKHFLIQGGAYEMEMERPWQDHRDLRDPGLAQPVNWKPYDGKDALPLEFGIPNGRGTIAMSRDPDEMPSFFINHEDNSHLDSTPDSAGHVAFGFMCGTGRELAASEATLDAIAAAQTRAVGHFDSLPVDPVMILNIVNPYAGLNPDVFLDPGGEDIDDDNVTPS